MLYSEVAFTFPAKASYINRTSILGCLHPGQLLQIKLVTVIPVEYILTIEKIKGKGIHYISDIWLPKKLQNFGCKLQLNATKCTILYFQYQELREIIREKVLISFIVLIAVFFSIFNTNDFSISYLHRYTVSGRHE